ncbi:MAG: carboxylesterase family protein [Hydrogenophaga sp.]
MSQHHLNRREWLGAGAALGLGSMGLAGCATPGAQGITGATGDKPIATVAQGQLQGTRAGDVLAFKRVPYAANPFLPANRFKAPQPMPVWSGVRDATKAGPLVPQPSRARGGGYAGEPDDLTMNIWVPVNARNAPVMVWFSGGAFYRVDASSEWSDGTAYAKEGVVVVSVNFRVGIDGFMSIDGVPSNRAYLDKVAALKWVAQNIGAFGGNPGDVTMAGQSSGAQGVLGVMGMPAAKGLFHKVIAQSPSSAYSNPADAKRIAAETAKVLGVEPTAQALAAVPLPALIAGVEKMIVDLGDMNKWGALGGVPPFLPILDGSVVTQGPVSAVRLNAPQGIPLLVGSTEEEARLYTVPSGAIDRVTPQQMEGALRGANLPANAEAVYRQARPNATPGDMTAALRSDRTFRIPAVRHAETRVKGNSPVWHYHFAWSSPAFNGRLGSAHVVDVPYVFNTLKTNQAKPFMGGAADQALADKMQGHWLRFIKTGNPGWERYDLSKRPTMRFDTTSAVVSDPMSDRRLLWADKTFN